MRNKWDVFFKESMDMIFKEKKDILDIGGGLRIDKKRGDRLEPKNFWLRNYLDKVNYRILDKTDKYSPDIIGDIHQLPLENNSVDAVICMAVLEHVEEPQTAVKEIHRVLKNGGYAFIYVPFLYYYHPMEGYYKDFYRFTYDGVKYLVRDFSRVEIQNVRGSLSTVSNLLPIFSKRTYFFEVLDKLFKKEKSKQTSGFNILCVK